MQDKWTDGEAYEMYVGRWSRRIGEKFLSWLDMPSGQNWLDLGCGTGALTSQILSDCSPKSIVGIEPSAGFLSLARENIRESGVKFLQGSGEKL
ncbi:MAG TPA: class I SAM-dependent methyltransferase, partial [Hyphomicrobiaceae bacterium]|nr:class I SAM-dependent methyltransferase [Hyphomicrobiaceae bacterium]